MKTICLVILTIGACLDSNFAVAQTPKTNIDSLINGMGSRFVTRPGAVGLSVGLFYNGIDRTYNFGSVRKGADIKPTSETVYAIGSIGKTFISLVLAHAVLEKRVRLNDDIRKYLKGNYPNLEYNGKPVTLQHLANTTSALPENLLTLPEYSVNLPADSIKILRAKIGSLYSRQDFFEALHRVKLDTMPGTKARHNNCAPQLLAFILENVYKKTYTDLVEQYILTPLEMTRTTYLEPGALPGSFALGYDINGNKTTFLSSPTLAASGGMTSTVNDLLKYIHLQLKKDDSAIAMSHQKMFKPDIYAIGLNWLIYRYDDGYSQVWTDGSTLGFSGFIIVYPELSCGMVLLTNEADNTSYQKLSSFADKIFNALKQK